MTPADRKMVVDAKDETSDDSTREWCGRGTGTLSEQTLKRRDRFALATISSVNAGSMCSRAYRVDSRKV